MKAYARSRSKIGIAFNLSILLILLILLFSFSFTISCYAQVYEISGSPFATEGAPLPQYLANTSEKFILVEPREHFWGAYNARGKLLRWGIATAGAGQCVGGGGSCRTTVGQFRIYSLGNAGCISNKYNGASMPYCMYFNGGQALHGSSDIQFDNISHGCVRLHVDDAKWLRYHFVAGPNLRNHYRGTKVVINPY